ncbi:MAG TPA: hypothetical protein VKC51_02465 [Lacunisphaera sp.]|nr:hypothetical protein [Lacunisphaera sp.]
MSPTYRVTLVQLTADASTLAPSGDKAELGNIPAEEIQRLAGRLLKVNFTANPKAEPGILVQRGDKGWRIAVYQGRLRMHKSMSLFDDFWTADSPADLAGLPPFHGSGSANPNPSSHAPGAPRRFQALRAVAEAAGLFVVALVLVAVGLRFGLPQRKLSDLPPEVVLVNSAAERAEVFTSVAGSYWTGKAPGNQLVVITSDGQVSLGGIGKDGKPTKPRFQEQARAGRNGNIACVITSFGVIAGIAPPETVNVGRFQYRRATLAEQ